MNRLSAGRRVRQLAWWLCVLGMASAAQAHARPAAREPKADPARLLADMRVLATQKPWACPEQGPRAPDAAWEGGAAECTWQNRLRKRTWRWSDSGTADCVSRQARWWAWMHAGLPATTSRQPWQAAWTAQGDRFAVNGEQRVLIVERGGDGAWTASEWRWNPSPRAATRRWQEGRWKLLTELADRRRQAVPAAAGDAGRLHAVFGAVAGARPAEIVPGAMRLETDGACLTLADPLPGRSRLPLSYRPDDSRLEQRAAMHLLLSRQFPQATWLAPFQLVAMPTAVAGGAKFMAVWLEGEQLKGQLWMPSKDGKPTVRVRMTTPVRMPRPAGTVPPAVASATPPALPPSLSRIQQAVERELRAVAVRWAQSYE